MIFLKNSFIILALFIVDKLTLIDFFIKSVNGTKWKWDQKEETGCNYRISEMCLFLLNCNASLVSYFIYFSFQKSLIFYFFDFWLSSTILPSLLPYLKFFYEWYELTGHPMLHLKKEKTSVLMGAPAVTNNLILPPNAFRTFFKTKWSHMELFLMMPLHKTYIYTIWCT